MDITVKSDCSGIDWQLVAETLRDVGMGHHAPDLHRKAFENSHTAIFIFHRGRMFGFGRAISDGAYQAAVYDVAVHPDYQKKGLGNTIMENILARLPDCNVILYASPGKEEFYRKHKFRKMKTGMALFRNAGKMADMGFTD